jgi:tRNA-specific 2-thiouridylase
VFLKKAKDSFKDQTYFLADLNVKQLKRACFPIGNYLKTEVREIATRFNLPNQNRKDSQGICFLGKIKYHEFIRAHLGEKEGDLIEFETGKMLGRHPGYWFYTIGQRQRIGLSGGPWFVVKKDIKKNIVYISKRYLENDQKRDSFKVTKFHWINSKPSPKHELGVKVRHGEKIYSARLKMTGKDIGEIHIDGCDQGFAAGQFAVFYTGDCCLGCATITN